MPLNRSKFRFETEIRVRNYEIDWQGIVHNAVYLCYFETGRIEYLKHVGVEISPDSIMGKSRIVVARNEIDYLIPARFGNVLSVLTRVSLIRRTSFVFEGILHSAAEGTRLAENRSFHVWLHPESGKPMAVPKRFRDAVGAFERGK